VDEFNPLGFFASYFLATITFFKFVYVFGPIELYLDFTLFEILFVVVDP